MEALNKNLFHAAERGDVDLAQDCLHKGADVHYKDGDGQTPLHKAAVKGYTEVIKVLVEAGASLSPVDIHGWTPLHQAAVKGYTEVIKVLVEAGASLSAVDYEGMTPLHTAAVMGNTEVIKVLVEAGASVSAVNKLGWTPLHLAAEEGHTEMTKVLMEAGASLSAVDNDGLTPLHLAAWGGHTEVTKVLLEAGASLSAVDNKGRTPLHLAALEGHTEVTKVLVEAGASLSAVDNDGWTPLHLAAWRGNTEVTKVLLEAGASLSAVDNNGKTPHNVAGDNVKKLLQKYMDKVDMSSSTDEIGVSLSDYGRVVTHTHLLPDFEGKPGIRLPPKRMVTPTTSRYESNYIKIAMVVLQVSPRAVRVQFDREFHPDCLQRTLNRNVFLLTNLKATKHMTQPQLTLLFPRTGEPSSKDFDITLMICLLRNLMHIDIMDNRLPSATDTSLRADLSRIKFYRNMIVHCDSALVDDTDFESYWNDVTPAILRLGGNSLKVECDDLYGRNLNAEQRDDGLKCIKGEKGLALVEEELAEQSKELAETYKKPIELEQEKRNKEWFYKLDVKCDNIDIHCIVDRRLEGKYVSLNSVYQHEPYGQHLIDDDPVTMTVNQLNQTTQSEFEQLYIMKSTVSDRTELDLRHALVDASRQQFSILCRWLMANIHNKGVINKEMESALDIAFKNLDKDTAKAISWCITKTFYKTFQVNLSHCFDVYPGLRCQCLDKGQNTNALCSNDKLIIITSRTEVKGLPAEYKGFKIKIMDVHDKSTEKSESETLSALLSQNCTDSYHIKVNISNSTTKQLFDSHSNLALICPSVHRSFSFARKHEVKNELCIQLYCKLKGILPLGEIHFPDSIHGIHTDVINGEACLISTLHIGDKIGSQTHTGTLGGFVKYLDFNCFLTCAHVMYGEKALFGSSSNSTQLPGATAYNYTSCNVVKCGKVIWRAFDQGDKFKTGVDAALVLMQNNWMMDPNDYVLDRQGNSYPYSKLGLSSEYLNSCILDHEELCVTQATAKVIGCGAEAKLEENVTFPKQRDEVITFSNIGHAAVSANGNTLHPLRMHTPASIRFVTGCLTEQNECRMYNQIGISLGLGQGDSGTCIYVVEHPKTGCIGMAIAMVGGYTIVTPLNDIFKRMGI